jgi:hypothetical protein
MNYIEIPAEIKAKAKAESKTRTKSYRDKMKEKVNNVKQLNKPTQQNEYGIIRKFLKWLW